MKENADFQQKIEKLVKQKLGMAAEPEAEAKPEKTPSEKTGGKKVDKVN